MSSRRPTPWGRSAGGRIANVGERHVVRQFGLRGQRLGYGGRHAGGLLPGERVRARLTARRGAGPGAVAAWRLCLAVATIAAAHPAQAADPTFDVLAIDVDGNTLLDQGTLEAAIYPYMGPGRSRRDVEAAQKALEAAYRAKGYQSVLVEVPRQTVDQGVLKLHVVEVPVGRLRVVGSKYHSLAAVRAAVPALAEGKVTDFDAAQAQLNEANRLPDRQVTPVIHPGAAPGTIDVDLKVVDTSPLHASLELNNAHSAFTTPLRLTGNVRYDNLWQLGHSASFTYAVAPERRGDGEVFAGSYMAPVWNTPFSLLLFGYNSTSNIATIGGVQVLGKGYDVGARAIYQFPTHGGFSQSLSVGLDFKHFREIVQLRNGETSPAAVSYAPLNATYTLRHQGRSSTTASAAITANFRGLGDNDGRFDVKRTYGRADFIHFNIDLDHTQPLWRGFEAEARLSGQVTNTPLVSSEQFAIGGAGSVRGYLEAEATVDDGAFASLELSTPQLFPSASRFVDNLRVFTFFDAASGRVRFPLAEQQGDFTLMSAGLGARFDLLDHLHGDVFAGVPLKPGPTRTDTGRAYGALSLKADF